MTTRDYHPRVTVTVNGLIVRTLSGSVTLGLRNGFATAQFALVYGQNPVLPNDRVQIALGYDETGQRTVFTGRCADDSLDYYPNGDGAVCEGFLTRLNRGLGVEDASADMDPTTGQRPAYQSSGKHDDAIVKDVLDLYGVPYADIQGDSPAQTFGTIEPVSLGKDEPGWTLTSALDFATFCRLVDGLDGYARRVFVSGLPGTASVTLTQGVSIVSASRRRSLRGITNHVTVTGLPDAGGPGVTPFGESFEESPTNPENGEPYIPTPPRYQSEGQSLPLLETEAQCTRWAQRRVAAENRLSEDITIQPERARPDIYPGMTLAISSDKFRYGSGYVFFVEQITHTWDAQRITTGLGLLASSDEAGVNPNMAPLAIIHITMERETLGDGSTIWVVFADGRDSYDPDGVAIDLDPQHGITTYLWSGSTAPVTPVGLSTATFVYTSDPTGQTISLQVADVHLKLGSATVTITAAQVAKVNTRVLWAAVTSDLLFSFDGGRAWASVGIAAVGCCEIAHPTYQLAWTAAGALWRITVDTVGAFAGAVASGPANITAASINVGLDGKGTGRAWAGGSDGKVWQSLDDGLSWVNVGTITAPTGAATHDIRAIEETPFPEHFGQLQALCGNAQFISFDAGVTWVVKRAYADTALTATRQASGAYSDLTVLKSYHWIAFAGTSGNAMSRALEADLQEDVDFPVGDKPVQLRGLTIGILGPKLIAGGNTPTTRKIWVIDDFTGGGNFVAAAYNTAFGDIQHLIRDGAFDTITYGAATANLFKSYDDFATILNLRTLTGGQSGKMIGYGPLHPPLRITGAVAFLAHKRGGDGTVYFIRLTTDGWHRGGVVPLVYVFSGGTNGGERLHRSAANDDTYYAWTIPGIPTGEFDTLPANLLRSTDNGDTWESTGKAGLLALATDTDGVVYALVVRLSHWNGLPDRWSSMTSIEKSADNGTTWTTVHADFISYYAGTTNAAELVVNPDNPLSMWFRLISAVYHSSDGGLTGVTRDVSPHIVSTTGGNDNFYPIIAYGADRVLTGLPGVWTAASDLTTTGYGGAETVENTTIAFLAVGTTLYHNYGPAHVGSVALPHSLRKSTDDGATWVTVDTSDMFNSAGLGYDPRTGTFYSPGHSGDLAGPLGFMQVLVGGTGAWQDVSQQYHDDLGDWYDALYRTVTQ
jgi:hypothetical protein